MILEVKILPQCFLESNVHLSHLQTVYILHEHILNIAVKDTPYILNHISSRIVKTHSCIAYINKSALLIAVLAVLQTICCIHSP